MPAFSARRFALLAAFCALGIGSGCGRETFDLLPASGDPLSASGSGSLAGDGGALATGSANASGGPSIAGANPGDGGNAAAGAGASSGSRGGRQGQGHGGTSASGGGAGTAGVSHSSICTQSEPFCTPCHNDGDCGGDAPTCDSALGCIQCSSKVPCPADETCNLIHRCAKTCKSRSDCADDALHQVCETDLEACVSCKINDHCSMYNPHGPAICYHNACVECFDNSQCVCNNGHCMH